MAAQSPEEVHSLFFEALNDKDLNKLLAVYEEGAILIPRPGDEPVNARKAISNYQFLLNQFEYYKTELQVNKIFQTEDLATVFYSWKASGPQGDFGGEAIDVVRRQPDGSWLMAIDNPWGWAGIQKA